jgi:DNA-binding response OmpR family regulator
MRRAHGISPASRSAPVMIVDDDREVVDFARRCLALDGYSNIVCVNDPLLAADIARRELPKVILLDASMPGVSGVDVLRALRSERLTESIPVILLHNAADTRPMRTAVEMGVREFLVKPIDPLEAVAKVRSVLLLGALRRSATVHAA